MSLLRRVVSLDGTWDLAFDPGNIGRRRGWGLRFPAKHESVPVPGAWERVRPGYDGVGWYRTRFPSPALPPGGRCRLRFHASSYFTEAWLNGERLGENEGGWSPFEFEIGDRLRPDNELVVRVINPPSDRAIEGFRAGAPLNQSDLPVGKSAWYFNFGGLWQGVDLVLTGATRIEHVFVEPRRVRRTADVSFEAHSTEGGGALEWRVAPRTDPDATVASGVIPLPRRRGAVRGRFTIRFGAGMRAWSPDDPFLYVLHLRVADRGGGGDALDTRFGMRDFTIRGGQFLLNGQPLRLKGLLQQGLYARSLAAPESPAEARREWMLLKKNGFNFLRSHLRAPEPAYLDLADELGLLVEAEPPIGWITNSPRTEARCRREIERMLLRDRNHPSIVFWCLLNEAYHFLGFTMPQVKSLTARLARSARRLDPSRIMMDTSGGGGSGSGGGSDVWLPYSDRKCPLIDAHAYCPIPPDGTGLRRYRELGRAGTLAYISEYGALEMPPDYAAVERRYTADERKRGLEDYRLHADFHASLAAHYARAGLRPVFGPLERFQREVLRVRADDLAAITASIWTNPRIAGMAYCQLADASGEQFGVTDLWRRPKPAFAAMVHACADAMAMPVVEPRVLLPGRRARIACRVRIERGGAADRWQCVLRGPGGAERVLREGALRAVPASGWVFRGALDAELAPGGYALVGRVTAGSRVVHEFPVPFRVLPPLEGGTGEICALDPAGDIARVLRGTGMRIVPFINNTRRPDVPIVLDLRRGIRNRALLFEVMGQARKTAAIGGTLVLLEPEMQLLREALLPEPPGVVPLMRSTAYVRPHPAVAGFPTGVVAGFEYADVLARNQDRAEDVRRLGGEIVIGSFGAHMWTRPANYFWGAALYRLPIGCGGAWVSQLHLLDGDSDAARRLLYSLVAEAAHGIRPADASRLLSRCIDPL